MNNQSKKLNEMCIAGIICSFFIPILGLILSIIGLNQAKKRNEDGNTLAIVGIIVGAIGTLFTIFVILYAFFAFLFVVSEVEGVRNDVTGIIDDYDSIPEATVKDTLRVKKGTIVEPEDFIIECYDEYGCEYEFENPDIVATYTDIGKYRLRIIVSNEIGNSRRYDVTLIVVDNPNLRKYVKYTDSDKGYKMTEIYELEYSDNGKYSLLESGKYTVIEIFENDTYFDEELNKHDGEEGYTFNMEELKETYVKSIVKVGEGYTVSYDVDIYLTNNGFKEEE